MGLDFVEIILELEEEFQISIPDSKAQNLTTVEKLSFYIFAHSKGKTEAHTLEIVKEVCSKVLAIPIQKIKPNSRFIEDLHTY